jgi:hypothetical protein
MTTADQTSVWREAIAQGGWSLTMSGAFVYDEHGKLYDWAKDKGDGIVPPKVWVGASAVKEEKPTNPNANTVLEENVWNSNI